MKESGNMQKVDIKIDDYVDLLNMHAISIYGEYGLWILYKSFSHDINNFERIEFFNVY